MRSLVASLDCMNTISVAPSKPVVCVVDGDPAVRDSLAYLCQSNGHVVQGFSTAGALLRQIDSLFAKCVICEAQLPDVSGIQLYLQLKKRGIDVPFALLVSRSLTVETVAANEAGIDFVLHKPLTHYAALTRFIAATQANGY